MKAPTVRVAKAVRQRLASATMQALANNVIGIGQAMDMSIANFMVLRSIAAAVDLKTLQSREAHQLAQNRAQLMAICDELRARIDSLRIAPCLSCEDEPNAIAGEAVVTCGRCGREYRTPK